MAGEDWTAELDALIGGDRAALARVARLVTARLRALGAYDLRDEWDDICQEVILALVRARKAGGVESAGRVVAFVRVTTFRHYCDWIRARLQRPRASADAVETLEAGPASSDSHSGLSRRIELLDLVSRLEAEAGYALVAHVVEGSTFDEIAADLGVSRPTAVRRVAEGKAELRALYDEGFGSSGAARRPGAPGRRHLRVSGGAKSP